MRPAILGFTLLLAACISFPLDRPPEPVRGTDYILVTRPDDSARKFHIELRSLTDRMLCFSSIDWPRDNGLWIGQQSLFIVRSPTGMLHPPDENPGSCAGPECTMRIRPHRILRATLNYGIFGRPEEVAALGGKTLEYNLAVSSCQPDSVF